MGQTFSSSSAGEQFYDIVLRCRPANLTTELGEKWDVEWPNRVKKVVAEVKQAGKAVGILGNFNRGKTWIMSQLSDFDLPDQGLTRKTEGLSMKWISTADKSGDPEEDEPYHLAIDTAGINSPIDVFPDVEERDGAKMESEENPDTLSAQLQRNKKMTARREQTQKNFTEEFNKKVQETEQYEHFLQTMTLQLADIIIVVMNETTFLDQNFLHNIVKKWRDLCVTDTSRYRQVYVIHNFRSTASIDERKKLFSSSTEKLYPGRKSEVNGVPIFVSGLVDFPTIHACLMFDDPKSRNCKKYNKSVFSLIKMWIRTCSLEGIAAKRDPLSLINRFEDKASMVLRKGFLANFKELRHLEKKNCISFLPEKANKDLPITRVKSREDRFYGPVTFVPPVAVSCYKSEAGTSCRLYQLELPGVDRSCLKVKPRHEKALAGGYFAIEVSGKKKKVDAMEILRKSEEISGKPKLKPDGKEPDFKNEENQSLDADSCRYGRFSQIFQIPMSYEQKCTQIWPKNGTVFLVFEATDRDSESGSDKDEDAKKT